MRLWNNTGVGRRSTRYFRGGSRLMVATCLKKIDRWRLVDFAHLAPNHRDCRKSYFILHRSFFLCYFGLARSSSRDSWRIFSLSIANSDMYGKLVSGVVEKRIHRLRLDRVCENLTWTRIPWGNVDMPYVVRRITECHLDSKLSTRSLLPARKPTSFIIVYRNVRRENPRRFEREISYRGEGHFFYYQTSPPTESSPVWDYFSTEAIKIEAGLKIHIS